MIISKDGVILELKAIVSDKNVITDTQKLKDSSVDRFRKYETIHGVYTQPIPTAIVKPTNVQEVANILKFLNKNKINCVPRTGFTSTEGGLEVGCENTVILDGSGMNKIINIDLYNMQATAQCGVVLQDLEDELRAQGYTTGHSPQSKPIAQMGGLVATRSIGQFSTLYGGIEDMLVGLEAVFPNGEITRIKNVPRRAAGPDIRHVVMGNEGTLCFITEVTVKIFKYTPENNLLYGYTLDDMQTGFEILREVMVNGYRPSVARLYDAEDGKQHFTHFAKDKCVLIFMAEGPKGIANATGAAILEIVAKYPQCKPVETQLIKNWFDNLNWGVDKVQAERDFIKKTGNMGFTTEVSGSWSCIHDIYKSALRRVREEFPRYKDLTMLGGHSSHSYINGTNMYFVFDYNVVDCKPEDELKTYHYPLHQIFCEEAVRHGGSMAHHHGIGKYRTQWTKEEHGSAYYILKALKDVYDPNGIMNYGSVYPKKD
ncbi:FAD-linked oxidoreductase [Gammaproteobacteria bacterium]|nr:FAD-linked oxidoreductase [Gammaproteobacteria bacterium]